MFHVTLPKTTIKSWNVHENELLKRNWPCSTAFREPIFHVVARHASSSSSHSPSSSPKSSPPATSHHVSRLPAMEHRHLPALRQEGLQVPAVLHDVAIPAGSHLTSNLRLYLTSAPWSLWNRPDTSSPTGPGRCNGRGPRGPMSSASGAPHPS